MAAQQQKTKPGRLSDVARHLVLPSGIVSTGWPAVRDRAAEVGIVYDDWQDGLGRAILAKREDGQYAASIGGIVVSICRQVGKTFTVGSMIVMLCLLFPGMKVLWTAHRTRTSDETFKSLSGMVRRKKIWPHVAAVRQANGQQEIEFRNGSRILFGAREQGFGRGFDDVDVEVFDEAQILGQKALDDMIAAMNVAPNPIYLMIGTPPKPSDPSEAFSTRRKEALEIERRQKAGEDVESDMVFVEISADRDADIEDRGQWRKGNPSYPHRTPESAMLRMKRALGDESFRREGLGIWDNDTAGSRLITASQWMATGATEVPEGVKSFGVAFSQDGSRVSLGGARKHDGGMHVELIDALSGGVESGIGRLADWLAERWHDTATIVISGAAGAKVLHQALRDRGVSKRVLHLATSGDYFTACAMFHEAVSASAKVAELNAADGDDRPLPLTHLATEGQAPLDDSVAVSDKKNRGPNGAWGWQATTPDGDETPTEAVSLAHWGARTSKRRPGRKAVVL